MEELVSRLQREFDPNNVGKPQEAETLEIYKRMSEISRLKRQYDVAEYSFSTLTPNEAYFLVKMCSENKVQLFFTTENMIEQRWIPTSPEPIYMVSDKLISFWKVRWVV